jgi:hypothetical protein
MRTWLAVAINLLIFTSVQSPVRADAETTVYSADFDNGVPPEFGGAAFTAPVEGYSAHGFSGSMLFNEVWGSPSFTTTVLTLHDLPPHNRLKLKFLLAIIDSWDGNTLLGGGWPQDYFTVYVDGVPAFSATFDNFNLSDQTAPTANLLTFGTNLARTESAWGTIYLDPNTPFTGNIVYADSAYDMGHPAAGLDSIPHTGSSVVMEFMAHGSGWQGGGDESWGIDNLEVMVFTASTELQITSVSGPVDPIALRGEAAVAVDFTHSGSQDVHTCTFSWDDGQSSYVTTTVTAGTGSCTGTHIYAAPGVYTVTVTVTGGSATATSEFRFVVVYDRTSGFVTGGGWITSPPGAFVAAPDLTGRANFGFVSKYTHSAKLPSGQTQFQFSLADFNFHSTTYQWLVVSGARAQFKGVGTVNAAGNFGFLLTAIDGQQTGGGGVDRFRIKISDLDRNGEIVYDNVAGDSDDLDEANPMALGGGSIVIHR